MDHAYIDEMVNALELGCADETGAIEVTFPLFLSLQRLMNHPDFVSHFSWEKTADKGCAAVTLTANTAMIVSYSLRMKIALMV